MSAAPPPGGAMGAPDFNKDNWQVTVLTLGCRMRFVARRVGVTYIYTELESRSWYGTKLRGGRVIAEREFESQPLNVRAYLRAEQKRRAA